MVKLIGYLIVSLLATAKMVAANNDTIFYETQALNSEAIGLNEPASIPTPNTTALAQYGIIPTSLHTGKANVSVPLYNKTIRGVNLNMELLYDTSGLLVNALPSWTGHSWTLSIGGVISRTIKGRPDEFINGVGPEFSVILSYHPYTQEIMKEEFVKKCQNVIKTRGKNGKYTNVGRPEFFPWQADPFSPMQFVGTYRYDGYSSKNGKYINNVVTDTKSVTSLIYHIPFFNNHRRSQNRNLGNTYQFYIWRTKK